MDFNIIIYFTYLFVKRILYAKERGVYYGTNSGMFDVGLFWPVVADLGLQKLHVAVYEGKKRILHRCNSAGISLRNLCKDHRRRYQFCTDSLRAELGGRQR